MTEYINLHSHNFYSPMDGYSSPMEYAKRAKEIGVDILSDTNHGHLTGHRHHHQVCRENGLKPITGIEAYFSPTDRFDRRSKVSRQEGDQTDVYNHLIILAKNDNGIRNIQEFTRVAFNEGFYNKPRIDFELLQQYSGDLVVLSGCLNGPICKAFEKGNEEAAYEWAKKFYDLFGTDFYIELQADNPPEMNARLLELADKMNIKPVTTDDCHAASPKDKIMQEVFLILSTNPKRRKDADIAFAQKLNLLERFDYLYPDRRMTFKDFDLFLHNYEEKSAKFKRLGVDREDIFENTVEIADKIGDYGYSEGLDTLPKITVNDADILKLNVQAGLKKLGLLDKPEYVERAKYELGIIVDKNFSNYFLIVEDIMAWCRKQRIRVGPGRGSGSGSLVCYALGITKVDPLKENLLFERFLDAERTDWPDLDLDFEDSRRGEVKQYCIEKYEHVASITTINTYRGKKSLKDAAKVIGVPFKEVNKAMKILDGIDEVTGHDVIEEFKVHAQAREFNKKYPDVVKIAERLIDRVTGYGMHAAGLVIADKPIAEYAPIETRKPQGSDSRIEVVALDKNGCESLGLIKMDFLGLKTLTVLEDAVQLIKENKGKLIDLDGLTLDDPKVFEMLSEGKTLGVFQAESSASTKLIKRMGINNFNDMVVSNALVRPGAWNAVGEDYLACKSGKKKPVSIHPDVDEYMADTFHYCIFQEQMMRLSVDLAGFTVGESNQLRRGIGKKKRSIIDAFKPQFIEGAKKKISEALAEKIWKSFEEAGAYAFVKAHAVTYSMISYQTAWLKVHYPQEYMCALLRNEKTKTTDYLLECKRMGIIVKLPHINHSKIKFSIEGDALRMGLENVKYISDKLAGRIIAEAPYQNYAEFKSFVLQKGSGLNTRCLQSLNKYGGASFDDNPVPENYKENLYEYVGVPAFDSKMVTSRMQEQMRTLEDYTDDETFICMAMVKDVKRGEGKAGPWARVDMIDSSGTGAAFCNPDMDIVKGQMYVFLIANNSIFKAISLAKDVDAHENIILDFLRRPQLTEIPEGQYKILGATKRVTNAGKNMATLIVCDHEKNLDSVLVFSRQFDRARLFCNIGAVRVLELGNTKDGSLTLQDVY